MAYNVYEYLYTKKDLDRYIVKDEKDEPIAEPKVWLPLWEAKLIRSFINKILVHEDVTTPTEWEVISKFGKRIQDAEIKDLKAEIARLQKEQERDKIKLERLKEDYENSKKRNGLLQL